MSSVHLQRNKGTRFSINLWLAVKSGRFPTIEHEPLNVWTTIKLYSSFKAEITTKNGHDEYLVVCEWSDQ